MTRMHISIRLLAIIAASSLLAAGCSGNGDVTGTAGAADDLTVVGTAGQGTTSALGDKIFSGGDHVSWQVGEPISYYSYASVSTDDAQRVTIKSFEYVEKADIPDAKTAERAGEGELVLHLQWEHVLGDVQANDGYIVAYADGSDEAASVAWYRDDNMPNGGVDAGEPQVGTFSYLVDRGPTTLILVDYLDKPVAELKLDTSS